MPCSELALDAGYLSKIPDHAQSQEVYVLYSFWELIGASGLHTRTNSRTCEDRGDIEVGSTKECETTARYFETYGIL